MNQSKRRRGLLVVAVLAAASVVGSTLLPACSTESPKSLLARKGQKVTAAGGKLTYMATSDADALLSSRALSVEGFTASFDVGMQLPNGTSITSGNRRLRFEKTYSGFRVYRNDSPIAETDAALRPVSGDARALTGFTVPVGTAVGYGTSASIAPFTSGELSDTSTVLTAVAPDAIVFDGVAKIGEGRYIVNVATYLHKHVADNPAARDAIAAGEKIHVGDNGALGAIITSYLAVDDGAKLHLVPAHLTQLSALADPHMLTVTEAFTAAEQPALLGTLRLNTTTLSTDDATHFGSFLDLYASLPANVVDVFRADLPLTSIDLPCLTTPSCDAGVDSAPTDTGTTAVDSGTAVVDTGTATVEDTGTTPVDTGTSTADADLSYETAF
jgi:hypothetical protein